ncbi:unnamed protein product [Rhizoctonia solani]|uniref:Transmembrane protein n=3 Tax=Rhizoctonia solani TaxID=456999 RepID=A0A8H3CD57_9AGAM|nr:transmembrane protein, putative [Rhizoctonia solani AG-3 Rhs1AP]KEP48778.1 putative transmembrane protein [Rhizoctonia solani 123E]CAE6481464.1 unnamed protein product [Rhizoctonia solani]CAE6506853.1 unnamed protein product [Rhizoctonia solani]
MLLALPIIFVAVASYIQFAFIQNDGFKWFRPLMWDALEDLQVIMRRRMPLWMLPISAGIPKLGLPAPILTKSATASGNQTLMAVPSLGVSVSGFNVFPFDISAWIVLCGTIVCLCLAGIYALWNPLETPNWKAATRDSLQEPAEIPKLTDTMHHIARPLVPTPGVLVSISELVSPNQLSVDSYNSVHSVTRILGPINRLPMAPTVPGSRLDPPLLNSTPATAGKSTWDKLRVLSSTESPNAMDAYMSRYWRGKLMNINGVPHNSAQARMAHMKLSVSHGLRSAGPGRAEKTDTGVVYSTPSRLPAIREEPPNIRIFFLPRRVVNVRQEPSNTSSVDLSTCTYRQVERPLEAGPPGDVPVVIKPTIDEPEASPGVGNLDTGVSTTCVSSEDSTLLAVPGPTEHADSPIGGTPDLIQVQVDLRDDEANLVPGSAASSTWVGLVALRGSLAHPCSNPATHTDESEPSDTRDMNDHSPIDFDHENAWANDDADSLEPFSIDGTDMAPDASNRDHATDYGYSECIERLCTCSDSSTSIGWMSQRSLSPVSDTPLITPSNSMPQVSRTDKPSCPKEPLDVPGSNMDFIFESQLSQSASSLTQYGSLSVDTDKLDSFVKVQPSVFLPANSDGAHTPNLSPKSQTLQCSPDDRTYAEVAGVPSVIESARATLSLSRWRIPRPGPQRHEPNSSSSTHSSPGLAHGDWAGHGESRRGRRSPVQPVKPV